MTQTAYFPQIPTLESLAVFTREMGVTGTISHLQSLKGYANKPPRPAMPKAHTSQGARQYAEDLEAYEKEISDYNEANKLATEHNRMVHDTIVEYIKDESGLAGVPEKYRDNVYSFAWDKGHSAGYYEVYTYLCDLVEIFEA